MQMSTSPILHRTRNPVMNSLYSSPIVFSEWLPTGIMVHFEGNISVFFPAQFLYEQRDIPPNRVFQTHDSLP
jgi:hypothetical protein